MDYPVSIKTPLGRFSTVVEIEFKDDDTLSGGFEVMGLTSTFSGRKLGGKNITFKGVIDTPMGEIGYESEASIDGKDFYGKASTRIGELEFHPLIKSRKKSKKS